MMKKITLLSSLIFASTVLFAQDASVAKDDGSVTMVPCTYFGISKPLSNFFEPADAAESNEPWFSSDREHRVAQEFQYSVADGPQYGNDPTSIQNKPGDRMDVAILTNWAGQTGGGSCPPDPSGAVGTTHYVQMVNATPFKIFNKTTGAQMGTIRNLGSLWVPAVTNYGDPIVLYDKYADRWFLAQFGASNAIYIAISTTNDPTGSYYTYTFTSPAFPDYLKFSIWQDGYYMTSNQSPQKVFAFERVKMITGDASARSLYKTFTVGNGSYSGFWTPTPADADGQLPPVGTPFPFFSYGENAWGSGNVDGVKIWTMTVDWVPTTPTAVMSAVTVVPCAAYDASYNSSWNDVYQPGTTQMLDGIGGVIMYRAQWRKWVGYNTVVLSWGVKISATQRSVKWAELRQNQTTGTWSLYQDGIYTPDASTRWMSSISMDDNGSIALCYAKSSSAAGDYPSLAFTGRLKTDPLGTMSFAETIAIQGTSSLTSCGNRYGDYSQTSLDPNGLTFWHTGEYVSSGIKTRIYSFQLPVPTGVAENLNASSFSVYQSGNQLNVRGANLLSKDQMVVDLFDREGRMIKGSMVNPSAGAIETTIDVAGLAKGTYLVRIGNADFQKVVKVAVN
jgi:hypothetical protein